MLPDEKLTPEQIAIFRQMTPERRLSLAEQLYWTARELKAAWLHARHPEWTEQQVAQEVTRLFLGATSLAADAGVYLMLAPLSVGHHTIHLTGTQVSVGFTVDTTYEITVAR